MKQLVITEPGKAIWTDAPIPQPSPTEVLVKVEAVTTCPQWDLHIMNGEPMFSGMELSYPYHPGQPGHEMVGEVVAAGSEVVNFVPGTRVAVWRDSGPARPGAYAEYVALPSENLLPVKADLKPEDIASLELAMCVHVSFDQLAMLGSLQGKTLGITGLGPAGLIAVQIGKALGAARVVAFDLVTERCELALELGADEALDPADEKRDSRYLDFGLDMTGFPKAIDFLVRHTKTAVAVFGVLRDPMTFPPSHWYGGFTLMGYGDHNLGAARRALSLIDIGALRLAPLVTHQMEFDAYEDGIELLRNRQAIKILFSIKG